MLTAKQRTDANQQLCACDLAPRCPAASTRLNELPAHAHRSGGCCCRLQEGRRAGGPDAGVCTTVSWPGRAGGGGAGLGKHTAGALAVISDACTQVPAPGTELLLCTAWCTSPCSDQPVDRLNERTWIQAAELRRTRLLLLPPLLGCTSSCRDLLSVPEPQWSRTETCRQRRTRGRGLHSDLQCCILRPPSCSTLAEPPSAAVGCLRQAKPNVTRCFSTCA